MEKTICENPRTAQYPSYAIRSLNNSPNPLGRLTSRQYDQAGRLSEASYAFAGGKSVTDFWERIYLGIIPEKLKTGEAQEEEDLLTAELESLAEQNPLLGELGFSSSDYLERLNESYLELAEVFPELKGHKLGSVARPKRNFAFKANWGHLHKRLPEELKSWFGPGKIGELLEQPQWTERFTYDPRGNITTKSNGWGEISYLYNAENQLLQAGEREYTWDANGNMTGESLGMLSASYTYDGENRLTELSSTARGFIARPGSPLEMGILYSYDALGRRVSREQIKDMQNGSYRDRFASSGERMSYLYDGLSFNVLAEGRDTTGRSSRGGWHGRTGRQFKPTSEYLRTGSRLITRTDVTNEGHSLLDPWLGGYQKKRSYLQDEQGSVIGELDKRGRLAARYTYDAFGALTEGRFDGINRLGYNGKRVDGYTGRYDYGYRAYDPLTMRWTTVDPVKDGTNWYTYVSNDPVNLIDPFGLTESDAQASANPYATWIAKPTGAPLTDEEAKVQKIFGTGEMILGGVGGVAACEVTAGGSVLIGLNVMADGANLVSEADNKRKVNPGDMYIKLITSTATGVKTQNGQDIPFQSPLP